MKKLASILLLSILLFNIIGHKLFFAYLEESAAYRLDKKIDAGQFDESLLVEVQIPLQQPYYTDSEYESYYGQTKFNGKHYRFVKRKVSGNTLYLLCLPDAEQNNLAIVKTDFVKLVNDIPQNGGPQKNQPSFIKLLLSEFIPEQRIHSFSLQQTASINSVAMNAELCSQFEPSPAGQPPDIS